MDNKKVANLLRSVADVFEQDIDGDVRRNLVKSVTDLIEDEKNELKKKAEKVKQKYSLDNALALIRKMEENDKIRAYKDKLKEVDPKYKRILTNMDKVREEVIQTHLKEFKLGLEPKDLLTAIPNASEFTLPNGKTLKEVLMNAKSTFGINVDNSTETIVK
jgi:hypothetical protein